LKKNVKLYEVIETFFYGTSKFKHISISANLTELTFP